MKDIFSVTAANPPTNPLAVADSDGKILYVNDAAHKSCAALVCGENIFSLFPSMKESLRSARASGKSSFTIENPGAAVGMIVVDISLLDESSVIRVYPKQKKSPPHIDYMEAAREFAASAREVENSKRVSLLYDTLASSDGTYLHGHEAAPRLFTDLLSTFFSSALPAMRRIGHELRLEVDDTVNAGSLIVSDIHTFYLILSSLASAVGYAADRDVLISASHTIDFAVVTVSAKIRDGLEITDASSFGPSAPDVIFAFALARAAGFELTLGFNDGSVMFTLRAGASSYYPEWLKTASWESYFMQISADDAASLIA